ncbi:type II secretion system F family protein [Candidatus Woesearchaeota archaeon]|nr:type II secretion system F family protein [Candidatus Woesearchaeota archaeon]
MKPRIPFVYFPLRIAKKVSKKFSGLARCAARLMPQLEHNLKSSNIGLDADSFIVLVTFNAFLWFFLSSVFLFSLINITKARTVAESLYFSLGLGALVFVMILFVTVRYPKIKSGKKAEQVERNLVFALKDLLLQVSAGMSLYDSFVLVSNSDYGEVSREFERSSRQIQAGVPMDKALENMALRSNSEYLKRTVWQMVNVLRSGSNFKSALRVVIDDLLKDHQDKIKEYSQELNMWSLMFMLFAVAIPTIGSTVMLIMTSFSGASITRTTFMVFAVMCLLVQYVIIGLIQSRRPQINF